DHTALEQDVLAREDLVEDLRARLTAVAKRREQLPCGRSLRRHDDRLDGAAEAEQAQPVVERLDAFRIALRPLDRARMQADDVEENLMWITGFADEGDVALLPAPIAIHSRKDGIQSGKIASHRIGRAAGPRDVVAPAQPRHAR